MTPPVADETWAEAACASRAALRLLGRTHPDCLPGEPGACGGTYADHALANYAFIMAVCAHQIAHLGPPGDVAEELFDSCCEEVTARCTAGVGWPWRPRGN